MLTKKEANKLRGLIARKSRCDMALWALNSDTRRGCNFEHLRAGVMVDKKAADEALYGAIRKNTAPEQNTQWFYVLMVDNMYVQKYGLASGPGTWLAARRFSSIQDARAAIASPGWHNDPSGVIRVHTCSGGYVHGRQMRYWDGTTWRAGWALDSTSIMGTCESHQWRGLKEESKC
jgi:hypothetical protein